LACLERLDLFLAGLLALQQRELGMDYTKLIDFSDLKFAISDLSDLIDSLNSKLENLEYKVALLESKIDELQSKTTLY
jgi:predicted  nucleic acid-binding Zn-ribbon protein